MFRSIISSAVFGRGFKSHSRQMGIEFLCLDFWVLTQLFRLWKKCSKHVGGVFEARGGMDTTR